MPRSRRGRDDPPRHSARPDPSRRRRRPGSAKTGAFATPLGNIPLDAAALAALAELPQVVFSDHAHAQEHSLEVHLPFLQSVLDDFTLVPLAVGHATPRDVAEVLDLLWGGPETLIVISSDLSHFLPYAAANQIDRDTAQHILRSTPHIRPRAGLRRLPDQRPAARCPPARPAPHLLHRAIPATPPATGSASSAMPPSPSTRLRIMADLGTTLLTLARNAIAARFGLPTAVDLGNGCRSTRRNCKKWAPPSSR